MFANKTCFKSLLVCGHAIEWKPEYLELRQNKSLAAQLIGSVLQVNWKISSRTNQNSNNYNNPDYEIKQTNIVFNFLGDFNNTLKKELSDLTHKKDVTKALTNCQKWIMTQNCEITKKFYSLNQWNTHSFHSRNCCLDTVRSKFQNKL